MKNILTRSACSIALTGAVLLGMAPFTHAQDMRKPNPSAQPTQLSDKDISAFAKAYVEYQKIRQTYEPRLKRAQNAKEKERIQREGDLKVKEALEKNGLISTSAILCEADTTNSAVRGTTNGRRKAKPLRSRSSRTAALRLINQAMASAPP